MNEWPFWANPPTPQRTSAGLHASATADGVAARAGNEKSRNRRECPKHLALACKLHRMRIFVTTCFSFLCVVAAAQDRTRYEGVRGDFSLRQDRPEIYFTDGISPGRLNGTFTHKFSYAITAFGVYPIGRKNSTLMVEVSPFGMTDIEYEIDGSRFDRFIWRMNGKLLVGKSFAGNIFNIHAGPELYWNFIDDSSGPSGFDYTKRNALEGGLTAGFQFMYGKILLAARYSYQLAYTLHDCPLGHCCV